MPLKQKFSLPGTLESQESLLGIHRLRHKPQPPFHIGLWHRDFCLYQHASFHPIPCGPRQPYWSPDSNSIDSHVSNCSLHQDFINRVWFCNTRQGKYSLANIQVKETQLLYIFHLQRSTFVIISTIPFPFLEFSQHSSGLYRWTLVPQLRALLYQRAQETSLLHPLTILYTIVAKCFLMINQQKLCWDASVTATLYHCLSIRGQQENDPQPNGMPACFCEEILLEHTSTYLFVYCFSLFVLQQQNRIQQRMSTPQSLKYLLYGPSQKKFADPCATCLTIGKGQFHFSFRNRNQGRKQI